MIRSGQIAMTAIAAAILAVGASAAGAGESGTLSGTGGGAGNAHSMVLGNGDTVTLLDVKQVINDQTDAGTAWYAGECVGTVTTKADGTYIGGSGVCTWHETENDSWDVSWTETGLEGGTFEITGGKGKWAGVTATGGTYTYVFNDGEKFRYTYSIDYTIP